MRYRRALRTEEELYPLERQVLGLLKKHNILLGGECIIIAVSGGPDSVALLNVLLALEFLLGWPHYKVIHFNHLLRDDAHEDEAFVRKLAHDAGLEFYIGSEDVCSYAGRKKVSLEMAAREYRHRFFFEIKEQFNARYISLGHTANDQAEELLLRLIRGTGPEGLAGMPVCDDRGIIRPLLTVSREGILNYLDELKLPYRIDSTNTLPFFQRNRIRNEVIPLLRDISKRPVEKILARTAELFRDETQVIDAIIDDTWKKVSVTSSMSEAKVWDRKVFVNLPVALQRRLIRKMMKIVRGHTYGVFYSHVEAIRKLIAKSASGRQIHLYGLVIITEGNRVIFSREKSYIRFSPDYWILPSPGRYQINLRGVPVLLSLEEFKDAEGVIVKKNPTESFFDADKIIWPLMLRFWQPGDRFCPEGMSGKSKKLQDFFVDKKIPVSLRHTIPILVDREKICWIIGLRYDERARVRSSTKRVLRVTYCILNSKSPFGQKNLPPP